MITTWVGALSLLIWVHLTAARGQFWRVSPRVITPKPRSTPPVAIIVPARNEADVVEQAIASVLAQDYAGPAHVYVVDDHSTDQTANAVRQAATGQEERLTLVSPPPLPPGWTGKMWALSQGVQAAREFGAEYFLFTDADTVHAPGSLSSLVGLAQEGNHDLVSKMVKLRCSSFAERALIPAFVFFFFMLYPPDWVNDPEKKTAAAAGGDILVRAEALAKIGGVAAIHNELIDDCALAREIKRNGTISLGLTQNAWSIRSYSGFAAIGRMISRNAFYQLRHSAWLLIGTILAMAITFLAPPMLIPFGGRTARLGAAAWITMSLAFRPTLRIYSRSLLWAPALPLIAAFYMGATVHSAVQYWLGRGGEWKDRVQDKGASPR